MAYTNLTQIQYPAKKKPIKMLNLDDRNVIITGLIISKSDAKFFDARSEKRGILQFILRDTEKDYLTCKIWATEEKIRVLDDQLCLGSIVDVMNPRIAIQMGDKADIFQPKCSSPFYLTVSDQQGQVVVNVDAMNNQLVQLMKAPLKGPSEILQLSDISSMGPDSTGDYVNLLVAVRQVRPPREIIFAKTGEKKKCLTVIIMDKSLSGMLLQLWSNNSIVRAEKWRGLETILHILDARIKYSEFHQAVTVVDTCKTIFVENPLGKEAEDLKSYASSASLQDMELNLGDDMIDGESI